MSMKKPPSHKTLTSFVQIHDQEPAHEIKPSLTVEQMVQQIKETADKLIRDRASRGDVKLLSTALKELRYAFKVFAPYKNHRKVTVFGSARLGPEHPAYQQAVAFGRCAVEAGFMVITGAAQGIMEAGHVGAGRENSIGVNILLPFEQEPNPIIAGDAKLMTLKYFFTRKLIFAKEADAVALFPGGFGTQDEGLEVLTLLQTGKSHMFPIVMVDGPGGDYWQRWQRFTEECLLQRRLISPADLSLYKITDSVEEAIAEIVRFYRVYHSMRYVGPDLVLRLKHSLPRSFLKRLGTEFQDIVEGGAFELTGPLPAEVNEAELANLPRLCFRFDRHNLGRLRQLIDLINLQG
jgi:uncharacterized protein (TIGR00730 family)